MYDFDHPLDEEISLNSMIMNLKRYGIIVYICVVTIDFCAKVCIIESLKEVI